MTARFAQLRSFLWSRVRPPSIVTLNVGVLTAAVVVGAALYAGRLEGQGDDLRNLNPAAHPSEWHYLTTLYSRWGQVGFGILMVPWRVVVRIFRVGPDAFPWWFFAGLNTGLNSLSVVHFALAGEGLLQYGRRWTVGLSAALGAMWILNPVTFATTVGIPVVFFCAYTLPLYLLSLVSLAYARTAIEASSGKLLGLVVLYVLVSINEATFTLSSPVLMLAVTAITALRTDRPLAFFTSRGVLWLGASGAAALFVWSTPGFHHRAPLLGFSVPSTMTLWSQIPGWYSDSVRLMYRALAGGAIAAPVVLHTSLLVCLGLGLCITFLTSGARGAALSASTVWNALNANILALAYLLAAHAAVATMLFTPYFPEYTQAYPALLLALGIGGSAIWAIRLAAASGAPSAKSQAVASATAGALAAAVVLWASIPGFTELIDAYRDELRASRTLRDVRQEIRAVHAETRETSYALSHCAPRLEAYGGSALTTDYFTWHGLPSVSVTREGAGDSLASRAGAASHRVRCQTPALFPWTWTGKPVFTPSSVRVVFHVAADGSGVEHHDFYVAQAALICTVTGSYNPNVAASPLYRNAFRFELLFNTSYSYAGSTPALVRSVAVVAEHQPKGAVNPGANVSVGYIGPDERLRSEVPLNAFGETEGSVPLLRVVVTGVHPGWLTAHTDVRLDCR